ncbi:MULTISPECIES: 5'-methylthioadenosine/S-adenosylhomocysteine nucleosidase [Enterococcus]|uniref:5'-methylthioadenosine/S-adenosylhomocysteine nucleosidase n=1 Tax=Enterococcus TaxID=1350 RepID=UPI00249E3135|nr:MULTISPECIES: 5'-methylthioadenosine/S-adenosylhomocysteine nucleosidase [Enterococcus]MDT2740056.1 5'-methylthioadenosine/S-adenosylhomocysteine nucleosidase [Enterococcus canintestini]WHA09322.1 5'-methylthioadenosine/S-adenosylhomocysteine nucleosidase [Enterococcus montenegrensis]
MKIAFVAAMELEIEELIAKFTAVTKETFLKRDFYTVKGENTYIFLATGQGKTNAAMYTQFLITKFVPDAIINLGVCGGITSQSELLAVYVGSKYCHYDIRKKQAIGKFPRHLYFDADTKLLTQFLHANKEIQVGIFGTGEGFVSSKELAEKIHSNFAVDCVDMESGAMAQCCQLNQVPFISIRAVCDLADRKKTSSDDFQKKAMKKVHRIVFETMNS